MIIKSNRKFGVEIEFFTHTADELRRISNSINVVHDGSLRPLPYAGEYVSPILQGEKGEARLIKSCEVLKHNGASADNPATSVHVHLNSVMRDPELRSSRRYPGEAVGFCVAVSNRIKSEVSIASIQRYLLGESMFGLKPNGVRSKRLDNVQYFSKGELTKHPKINYTYYYLEQEDPFRTIKNAFYFYTLYSDVMESIVSNSRRFGNMYCIPLAKSYDLDEIEKATNDKELRNIWYKGRAPNGHYDDSRYHNVNLHCYWDRHGTIEIRSHGGTIDPTKILLWVHLHQTIVDKVSTMDIKDFKFTDKPELKVLCQRFVDFIEEPMLKNYVKRLLGYYSEIKLSN